jgi:hypothetical protein
MTGENLEIPRICLSRSIEGCLRAKFEMGYLWERYGFYVYKITYTDEIKVVEPTMRAVPDTYLTQELWCLSPIKPEMRLLTGIVININVIYQDQSKYIFNDTCTFESNNLSKYCVSGEIFYNYIPAKIVKSPFIKYDQKYNNEYVEYLENRKIGGQDNPFEYEKQRIRRSIDGLKYYDPEYVVEGRDN